MGANAFGIDIVSAAPHHGGGSLSLFFAHVGGIVSPFGLHGQTVRLLKDVGEIIETGESREAYMI